MKHEMWDVSFGPEVGNEVFFFFFGGSERALDTASASASGGKRPLS